jgi:hypothetical protein
MYGLLKANNLVLGFISIATICSALTSVFLAFKSYELSIFPFLIASIYVFIYLWRLWNEHVNEKTKSGVFNKWIIFSLVGASLLIPLVAPKYLASESYLNFQDLKSVPIPKINELDVDQDDWITFKFTKEQSEKISKNINFANTRFNNVDLGYYLVRKHDHSLDITLNLMGFNKSSACLLIDFKDDWKRFFSCTENLHGGKIKDNIYKNIDPLLNLTYIDDEQVKSKLSLFRDKLSNQKKWDTPLLNQTHPLLANMLVKGAIFHHYNTVLQTIYLSHSPMDFFGNQYGFGPLTLVKSIAKLFDLSYFDALYFSITLPSFLILLTLLLNVKAQNSKLQVLFGFSMALLVTYGISNIIAPMLYFARYLPIILIAIYLFRMSTKEDDKKNKWSSFLFFILVVINAFYSFEYGLITGIAVLLVGLFYKDKFYLFVSSISLLISVIIKLFLTRSLLEGMSFITSIAGVGMGGGLGVISTLYLISTVALMIMFFYIKKNTQINKEMQLLFYILIALGFKVAWNASGNHIGAIFLIASLLIAATYTKTYSSVPGVAIMRSFYVFTNCLILLFTLINILNIQKVPSYHFDSLDYTQASFSKYFKISKEVNKKIQSFKLIYNEGDLVLSKNDDLLALATEQLITKPYQNVSTNINYPIDELHYFNAYAKAKRIVVDKSILSEQEIDYVARNFLNVNKQTDAYIYGYLTEQRKFKRIYLKLINSNFVQCEDNDYFVVLCSN